MFTFRRVVTGHDDQGRATVVQDDVIESEERLPGYQASTVWCTSEFPVSNDDSTYSGGAPGPRGSRVLLRIAEMQPGDNAAGHVHRTETLDYAVVLSGSAEMKLDDGRSITGLVAGDVVVQRGTNHGWVSVGPEPTRFLFVLIDAHPVRVGDQLLGEDLSNFGGRLSPMPRS